MTDSSSIDRGCAIGLGSNLGDSRTIVIGAIDRLQLHPQIEITAVSSWYRTTPVGPPQPDYINGCATIETSLAPLELLGTLHAIEADFGRVRRQAWLYDNLIVDLPNLQIPHPRMLERAFVLIPLAEIAPNWIEPKSGHSIATLSKQLEYSGVDLLS
jgi:2-amino-4-hydroxy-6-hydroxymethyldihydropteridine diphosphokinase